MSIARRFPISGAFVAGIRELLDVAVRPRFRAVSRRQLRTSARHAMAVVFLASIVDMVWLVPNHPAIAPTVIASNMLAAGAAFVAYMLFRLRRRVPVEFVLLGVLLAVDGSIGIVARIDQETAVLGAGYFLLLPAFVALLLPWHSRFHASWLAIHMLAVIAFALSHSAPALAGGTKILFGLLIVSSAVSVLGHFATLRARVDGFLQLEQIRSLNRAMRRRDLRMRAMNALLERTAVTDPLTGIGNRAALHRHLDETRNRIDRYGERFALLMLDLDHFKAINDTLGHFGGDEVLRQIAKAVDDATRASDGIYRVGGEEFLAVARLEGADGAEAVAERLREAVSSLGLAHPGNPPFGIVTVSVGGTIVDRDRLWKSDDAWLHAADVALYAAKRRGRNRSVIG